MANRAALKNKLKWEKVFKISTPPRYKQEWLECLSKIRCNE